MIRVFAGLVAATLVAATTVFASPSSDAAWLDTGVDLDTAGNEALALGSVQNCRSVAAGDSFSIDVWVTGLPDETPETPDGGVAGISYNLHFDPAVLSVTGVSNKFMLVSRPDAIPYEVIDANANNNADPDPLPAKTGNLRVDFVDINPDTRESGEGILTRLTLEAVGAGASTLILQDDLWENFPAPTILAGPPTAATYFVNSVVNGLVAVGQPCEGQPVPPPVDVGGLGGTIPGGGTPPPNAPPGVGGASGGGPGGDGTGGSGTQPTATGQASGNGGAPAEGETSVAIDAVPSENEATVVGEVETCASADVGDTFIVDLVVSDVEDLIAFEVNIGFDGSILEIVDRDVKLFMESEEGSQVVDTSKQTPNDSGDYTTGGVDTADPLAPESGSGVLARLTLQAKAEGTSPVSLESSDVNADGKADRGVFLRNVDGDIIGDENEDTFFDGPVAGGEIVVGEPCADSDAKVVAASGGDGSGDDDDGGRDALPFVIGGAVVFGLIAVAGAGYLAYRRRRETQADGGAPTADEPPSGDTLS